MNPSFQEAPISQIPALRFRQQLGYSYLSQEEVAVEDQIHGNPEPFLALSADIVQDSFQPYWHSLEIQTPEAYPS